MIFYFCKYIQENSIITCIIISICYNVNALNINFIWIKENTVTKIL